VLGVGAQGLGLPCEGANFLFVKWAKNYPTTFQAEACFQEQDEKMC
jgi:hypothetical protein